MGALMSGSKQKPTPQELYIQLQQQLAQITDEDRYIASVGSRVLRVVIEVLNQYEIKLTVEPDPENLDWFVQWVQYYTYQKYQKYPSKEQVINTLKDQLPKVIETIANAFAVLFSAFDKPINLNFISDETGRTKEVIIKSTPENLKTVINALVQVSQMLNFKVLIVR